MGYEFLNRNRELKFEGPVSYDAGIVKNRRWVTIGVADCRDQDCEPGREAAQPAPLISYADGVCLNERAQQCRLASKDAVQV